MKVYGVRQDYCEEQLEVVFSTPEKAAEYMEARAAAYGYGMDWDTLVEFEVDGGEAVQRLYAMTAQGLTVWHFSKSRGQPIHVSQTSEWDDMRKAPAIWLIDDFLMGGSCWARNETHAHQIAAEMYAKALAERDQGVTTPG